MQYLIFFAIAILLVFCVVKLLKREAERKQQLRYYYDEDELNDEPDEDLVDEDSGAYCIRCDTLNEVGAYLCKGCGQRIA